MSSTRRIFAACLLASCLSFAVSTQASERESETVEIKFYQLSTSDWTAVEDSFKAQVAAAAKDYCGSNLADCGLSSGVDFNTSDVGVASGPEEDSKSLKVSLYLDFPSFHVLPATPTTSYCVNKAALKTLLMGNHTSLEAVAGADITYIGDEFYSIDPASTMNSVLIPLAMLVLIAMIILTVSLNRWNKCKEQEAKKKQKALEREKRKKMSRIEPVFTDENETKKDIRRPKERSSRKKKRPQENGAEGKGHVYNGMTATLSMKTSMMTYDNGAAAKGATFDPVPLKPASGLPPMGSEEEERKREKKEKKKRKSAKRSGSAKTEDGRDETSETDFSRPGDSSVIPVEDDPKVVA